MTKTTKTPAKKATAPRTAPLTQKRTTPLTREAMRPKAAPKQAKPLTDPKSEFDEYMSDRPAFIANLHKEYKASLSPSNQTVANLVTRCNIDFQRWLLNDGVTQEALTEWADKNRVALQGLMKAAVSHGDADPVTIMPAPQSKPEHVEDAATRQARTIKILRQFKGDANEAVLLQGAVIALGLFGLGVHDAPIVDRYTALNNAAAKKAPAAKQPQAAAKPAQKAAKAPAQNKGVTWSGAGVTLSDMLHSQLMGYAQEANKGRAVAHAGGAASVAIMHLGMKGLIKRTKIDDTVWVYVLAKGIEYAAAHNVEVK